ncbi:MAG TPA: hypothetical protein VKU87_04545 [Thermomicrobiaceae bacterium]|nr:hypothetical protein [Thermomicrobiaceae bacterium]
MSLDDERMNERSEEPARLVVVLVNDLFFAVKIGNELKALGLEPKPARNLDQFVTLLHERDPVLAIIDAGMPLDWDRIAALRSDPSTADIPIIAFGPHKAVEALRAAKAAGVTRIVSNHLLHDELPSLVARYVRRPE